MRTKTQSISSLRSGWASTRARAAAGYTLIEVIVASAIIGVVFLSLYSGMAYGFTMIKFSRENQRATQILVEKMDTIRLYNWSQITSKTFIPSTFTATYYPAGESTSSGVIYYGKLQIDDIPFGSTSPNYASAMKRVTLTLTWTTGSKTRQRTLQTYVAQEGLQNYVY